MVMLLLELVYVVFLVKLNQSKSLSPKQGAAFLWLYLMANLMWSTSQKPLNWGAVLVVLGVALLTQILSSWFKQGK
ncbi:hypothetical protein ACVRZR_01785 [Streptococcus entericus]|uniref:hypothetical protein n=1 Tax=Streptococcus entericus TaxID=155680 RepID=UPI00035D53A2|nr:hypothetical protein [Streptococcus entericus]